MNFVNRKIRWLTIIGPAIFIFLFVCILLALHPRPFGLGLNHHPLWGLGPSFAWGITLFLTLLIGGGSSYFFSRLVFSKIQQQHEEISLRSEAMAAIDVIGTEITNFLNLEDALRSIVEKARNLLKSDISILCLKDKERFLYSKSSEGPLEIFSIADDPYSHSEESDGSSVLICPSDSTGGEEACCGVKGKLVKSHLSAPIQKGEERIGTIFVAYSAAREYSQLEKDLLNALAIQAGIAVETARLHEQFKKAALTEERNQIGREIHDGLAQDLSYLYLQFGVLERKCLNGSSREVVEILRKMKEVCHHAHEETREAIHALRTASSREIRLFPSLNRFIDRFEKQTGINIDIQYQNGHPPQFAPETESHLTRIIQEAFANVRKHSKANHASLTFTDDGETTKIAIHDNGVGFECDPEEIASSTSFGMKTMNERAKEIGGSLKIISEPNQGTVVEIRLPHSPNGKKH